MGLKFNKRNELWEIYIPHRHPLSNDVYAWCMQSFGPIENYFGSGWDQHGGWYKFINATDVTAFTLRWDYELNNN